MNEPKGPSKPIEGSAELGAPAAIASSSIVSGQVQGEQTWSLERAEYELKAEDAAHRRRQERAVLGFQHEEERKDNEARRAIEAAEAKVRLRHEQTVFWPIVLPSWPAWSWGASPASSRPTRTPSGGGRPW